MRAITLDQLTRLTRRAQNALTTNNPKRENVIVVVAEPGLHILDLNKGMKRLGTIDFGAETLDLEDEHVH
jgi:hypothetical protein